MYIHKTTVFARGAALSLIILMLLSGCSSGPTVQQPQPQPVVQTTPAHVLPTIDPATYHTVERGQTLFTIAQLYGRDYREIAQWNNIPPPYNAISPGQRLRIDGPNEGMETSPRNEKPAQLSPSSPNAEKTHTVQQGEGLYAIAKLYGQNYIEVAAWNQIEYPYALRPGQILKLSPPPGFTPTPSPSTTPQEPTNSEDYHIVLQGDTLYSLARHYRYSVADIALWNDLQQPYSPLSLGQRLRISPPSVGEPIVSRPPTTPTSPQPDIMPFYTPEGDSGYHIVAGGDTLYSLSRRYNQKVADIALWNNLQYPYPPLSLGQKLRVSPPEGDVAPAPYSVTPSPGGTTSGYHTVAAKETLYSISRRYGITVDELAALNGLQPPYPPLSLGQQLRVSPSTTRMKMPGAASDNGYLQPVKLPSSTYHIVRGGETLRSIAKQYGIPFTDLARWNGIGSPYNIYPGKRLTLVPSR